MPTRCLRPYAPRNLFRFHSLKINAREGQITLAYLAVRDSCPTGAGVPMSYRSGHYSEYPTPST